jgi:hypothetical protein
VETRNKKTKSETVDNTDIPDMEFAINMLRIKLHSTTDLSQKIRLYNQIKTLQDNISRLRIDRSSERTLPGCATGHASSTAAPGQHSIDKEWLEDLLNEMGLGK